MVFLLTVQPMRGKPRHYPREAKILTCVAQALHANPRRLLSFARRLVIDLYHHVNTMAARRLVIVVLDRHVNTMTAKRLAIIDPNHRTSLNITKRLAIIAQDRHASMIIAMRQAIIAAHHDIIMTVANREDIMSIIRLVITGSYHNQTCRLARKLW